MQPGKAKSVGALIDAAVRGELTRAQVLRLCKDNPEVITPALLAAGKRIAEQEVVIAGLQEQTHGTVPSPSTPSGMVPIYTKPNTPKRRKKPGARQGHPGHRRMASATSGSLRSQTKSNFGSSMTEEMSPFRPS